MQPFMVRDVRMKQNEAASRFSALKQFLCQTACFLYDIAVVMAATNGLLPSQEVGV